MSSLFAVLLKLKAENEAVISPTQGHHAHAVFLTMIRNSNPELAAELHEADTAKPFTISPLQGKFGRSEKQLKIIRGGQYFIRITFLQSDLFAHFMDASLKLGTSLLRLETASFHLDQVLTTATESPLCGHQVYENIIVEAQPRRTVTLSFMSPTVFRSGGKRNVLFPEPGLVFGSCLSRWNQFSAEKMEDSVSEVFKSVLLTRYRLETRILHFNGYQEVGFEGTCTYELPMNASQKQVKVVNALADFAFYCGTGAKTTMGMGQTRRIE